MSGSKPAYFSKGKLSVQGAKSPSSKKDPLTFVANSGFITRLFSPNASSTQHSNNSSPPDKHIKKDKDIFLSNISRKSPELKNVKENITINVRPAQHYRNKSHVIVSSEKTNNAFLQDKTNKNLNKQSLNYTTIEKSPPRESKSNSPEFSPDSKAEQNKSQDNKKHEPKILSNIVKGNKFKKSMSTEELKFVKRSFINLQPNSETQSFQNPPNTEKTREEFMSNVDTYIKYFDETKEIKTESNEINLIKNDKTARLEFENEVIKRENKILKQHLEKIKVAMNDVLEANRLMNDEIIQFTSREDEYKSVIKILQSQIVQLDKKYKNCKSHLFEIQEQLNKEKLENETNLLSLKKMLANNINFALEQKIHHINPNQRPRKKLNETERMTHNGSDTMPLSEFQDHSADQKSSFNNIEYSNRIPKENNQFSSFVTTRMNKTSFGQNNFRATSSSSQSSLIETEEPESELGFFTSQFNASTFKSPTSKNEENALRDRINKLIPNRYSKTPSPGSKKH